MRRALVLVACLLGVASAAWAAPLDLWHSYRGEEKTELERLVGEWNRAHPDQPVRALSVPYEAYANKLTASIPRGQGPDLFIYAHERLGDWARARLVAPVDGRLSADERRRFFPITLDALEYDGYLYGVPLAFKSVALIYNKATIAAPPRTTDEMIALASTFTDPAAKRFGIAYEAGNFYFHAAWLFGFDGRLFDDAGRPTLTDPGNVASVAFVVDLKRRGLIPDEPTGALVSLLFNEGRAAMVINGPWFLGEIDPGIDYGVAPLPIVSATGKPARPFLSVEAAIVSAYAKQPEVAFAFARFLAQGEGARGRLENGRQLVADRAVYALPDLRLDPHLVAFKDQVDRAEPMPNNPLMRAMWEPAAQALRAALRGAITPEQAMAQAAHHLKVVTRRPPAARSPRPYIAVVLACLSIVFVVGLARARRQGVLRRIRETSYAYGYLAPAMLSLLVLVLVPFVVGTAVAFFSHREGHFTFVGLANFINILASRDYAVTDPLSFYFTLGVTVMWTAANVALHVGIGLALAMWLRQPWLRLRGIYRVLLIVPWAVPNYITALIWKGMFHSQFGAINGLLSLLGIEPVGWFSHFWTAFAANVTTNTWLGFPFMMVVCLGALQAIPRDLEEAALMDGADAWTRFRRVILPQIKPALVPAVVLGSVWTFNMFNIIYLVSGGEPDGATEILISEAYRWAFTRQEQYGYAAAYATLIFLVLVVYSRMTRRLTGGAEAA